MGIAFLDKSVLSALALISICGNTFCCRYLTILICLNIDCELYFLCVYRNICYLFDTFTVKFEFVIIETSDEAKILNKQFDLEQCKNNQKKKKSIFFLNYRH